MVQNCPLHLSFKGDRLEFDYHTVRQPKSKRVCDRVNFLFLQTGDEDTYETEIDLDILLDIERISEQRRWIWVSVL